MKIFLHTVYKIFNKLGIQHTYIILFIFLIITKIECWPVFKQEPSVMAERRVCTDLYPDWDDDGVGGHGQPRHAALVQGVERLPAVRGLAHAQVPVGLVLLHGGQHHGHPGKTRAHFSDLK